MVCMGKGAFANEDDQTTSISSQRIFEDLTAYRILRSVLPVQLQSTQPPRGRLLEAASGKQPPRGNLFEAASSKQPPRGSLFKATSSRQLPRSNLLEVISSKQPPRSNVIEASFPRPGGVSRREKRGTCDRFSLNHIKSSCLGISLLTSPG